MKRILALALAQLILLMPLAVTAAESQEAGQAPPDTKTMLLAQADSTFYSIGFEAGQVSASRNYHSYPWLFAGLGSGMVPVLGPAVVAAVSQNGHPRPTDEQMLGIQHCDEQYQLGFVKGYENRAKDKAAGRTLVGGAVTTIAVATLIVIGIQLSQSFGGGHFMQSDQ